MSRVTFKVNLHISDLPVSTILSITFVYFVYLLTQWLILHFKISKPNTEDMYGSLCGL